MVLLQIMLMTVFIERNQFYTFLLIQLKKMKICFRSLVVGIFVFTCSPSLKL